MNKASRTAAAAFISLLFLMAQAAQAQNGTWTNLVSGNASGSWATAVNWNNSVIANGTDNTADFSTLNITTNSTVTLDGARTIGNIIFGDTTPDTNWVLNTGTAGPLTLAVTAGTPTITVNNQGATIGAVLTGTNGLSKEGAGTLRLGGANTTLTNNATLTNIININAGILQVDNNTALGATGNISSSNRVLIASGATLEIITQRQPNFQRLTVSGTGVGGTNGAIYANLTGVNNANTRLSIGLTTVANPAVTMVGDTTVRVDGTGNQNILLVGHITGNFTLTKTGGGDFRLDPIAAYSGGDIHIAQGVFSIGNANGILSNQTVTVDAGAFFNLRNNNGLNSTLSSLVLNGDLDLNQRGPADVNNYNRQVGTLSGSGLLTNGSAGTQTMQISSAVSDSTFNGTIKSSASGFINIVKNGAGTTLRLGGTNNYNGTTTVNGGTLLVNGTHTGGGAYTVIGGATLGGTGSIASAISLSGVLQAGDNGGTLTVTNVTGAGDVIISNANLAVLGQLNNSGSGNLNSLYLSNSVTTINLQGGSEASIYATTVNVDGTNNTLNVSIGNPALGQFPLIGGISSLGGLNGFSGLKLQAPLGVGAYLSNNTSSIDIVVTNIPALVWRGTPTGDWTIGGSANWLDGATPAAYTETAGLGPLVIFNDTAAGTASVNLTANVTPRGVTVSASSKTYTLSGTGRVGGTGGWVKEGSSTFTVANSGTNNFTGSVAINGGTVQLGNGGTAGDLGTAAIINSGSGSLAFNRSDDVTFANAISGNGTFVKQAANKVNLTGVGNVVGNVTVNAGTLTLSPAGSITVSGDVTGSGSFGSAGAGTVILSSANLTYGGGTVISNGTLQFNSVLPPSGNITDNGTLALALGGTLANNVSGSGGVSAINSAAVTLTGANTYSGPTLVLGGSVDATASTYPSSSVLTLGGQTGGSATGGAANFTAGNPVIGGLLAGYSAVNLTAGGQTLSINGNVSIGNSGPSGVSVLSQVTGTGASVVVNTNGGTIQIGLGTAGSGVNPDNVLVDFSGIDNFVANLGATGLVNLGTLDGNPGLGAGATVVNQFVLAAVSNSITAGTITVGAGGRQLIPELRLGAGTNRLNVDTFNIGTGGRDGGALLFHSGSGGVRVRAFDGVSRANMNVGVNTTTTTGAGVTNKVDLTGHDADLLLGALVIGNYPVRAGAYENTFSFNQGILDALSTSLSVGRNANNPGSSTLIIGGGTASLGPVSLTASLAAGTLNINNATVTVANITSAGAGAATLDINNSMLNLALGSSGNPVTAPVAVDAFNANGTVNLGFSGSGFTVGQFPLISYAGAIGGSGFSALNLTSLPSGVGGYLSNNVTALSVDVVVTNAPSLINQNPTNIFASVSGNQLTLGWPSSHIGWLLQSNSVSLTSTGAWVTVSGSGSTNQFTYTVAATKTNVFFRMLKP